jgi:hypothetical protein
MTIYKIKAYNQYEDEWYLDGYYTLYKNANKRMEVLDKPWTNTNGIEFHTATLEIIETKD